MASMALLDAQRIIFIVVVVVAVVTFILAFVLLFGVAALSCTLPV